MHAVKEGHSTASFWVSKCLYDSIFRVFSDHSDEDRYNTRNIFCIFFYLSRWAYLICGLMAATAPQLVCQ